MEIDKSLNTVMLDPDKCKGCVSCMRRCPTEAIRVRNGKAKVLYDRCIACGECVRICPHHAKQACYDSFAIINNFKYKIAVPAPSLYGQFDNLKNIDLVLNSLIKIGFDDVVEVALGAEYATAASKKLIAEGNLKKPILSSACPAVVELILMRFHDLKDNLLNLIAPVDVAIKLAREKAIKKGIPEKDIGVFFLSPCPAKVFALKMGLGLEKSHVDGVLSISEVYFKILNEIPKLTEIKPMSKAGQLGVLWSRSSGEAVGLKNENFLAVDGIENVINVLRQLEDGKLDDVDFVELNACVSGCLGGVLNIENPFVARSHIRTLKKTLPEKCNDVKLDDKPLSYFMWEKEPVLKQVFRLDRDREKAMEKMGHIDEILKKLPMFDCGVCGAPSCRAFAEDVANGDVDISMCTRLQEKNENYDG